jgi:hypothetical protein
MREHESPSMSVEGAGQGAGAGGSSASTFTLNQCLAEYTREVGTACAMLSLYSSTPLLYLDLPEFTSLSFPFFPSSITQEILDEDNARYCSNCKEHKRAKKGVKFWSDRLPEVLIFSLKRFEFRDLTSGNR